MTMHYVKLTTDDWDYCKVQSCIYQSQKIIQLSSGVKANWATNKVDIEDIIEVAPNEKIQVNPEGITVVKLT
jgi:hypothetical protein